jgi:Holliday junction resolvase-like predicted endonuclease
VHPRVQGDIGEASAIEWLTTQGAAIFVPLFHSPDYDLIAEMAGRLVRIEVKTTQSLTPVKNWAASICTRGGNQSWTGKTKLFDPNHCEFLYVHVGDGRRWFIPSARVEGSRVIVLGGRKYAEFEIELGSPLPPRTLQRATTTIASP